MTIENFLRNKELWSLVEDGIPTLVLSTSPGGEAQKKLLRRLNLKI